MSKTVLMEPNGCPLPLIDLKGPPDLEQVIPAGVPLSQSDTIRSPLLDGFQSWPPGERSHLDGAA